MAKEAADNQSEWETPVSRRNAGVSFTGMLAVLLAVAAVMLISAGCSEPAPAPVPTPIPPTATSMPTPSATPDVCQSADVVSYSDAYAAYRVMLDGQLVRLDAAYADGGASLDDSAVDDVNQEIRETAVAMDAMDPPPMFDGVGLHTARYVESLSRALTLYQQATSPAVQLGIAQLKPEHNTETAAAFAAASDELAAVGRMIAEKCPELRQ